MYKVGDKVIVTKYTIPFHGTIEYVKGYDIKKQFYIVKFDNGTYEHLSEQEIIKDE